MWTQFHDMHSGGGQKLYWARIYIEADAEEAKIIFQNMFDRNPERVTCTCCGGDYSINSHEDLAQLTGFERGCRNLKTPRKANGRFENDNPVIKAHLWLEDGEKAPAGFEVEGGPHFSFNSKYVTLADYTKQKNVKVIRAADIKPEWRKGELHEEGYVWRD